MYINICSVKLNPIHQIHHNTQARSLLSLLYTYTQLIWRSIHHIQEINAENKQILSQSRSKYSHIAALQTKNHQYGLQKYYCFNLHSSLDTSEIPVTLCGIKPRLWSALIGQYPFTILQYANIIVRIRIRVCPAILYGLFD